MSSEGQYLCKQVHAFDNRNDCADKFDAVIAFRSAKPPSGSWGPCQSSCSASASRNHACMNGGAATWLLRQGPWTDMYWQLVLRIGDPSPQHSRRLFAHLQLASWPCKYHDHRDHTSADSADCTLAGAGAVQVIDSKPSTTATAPTDCKLSNRMWLAAFIFSLNIIPPSDYKSTDADRLAISSLDPTQSEAKSLGQTRTMDNHRPRNRHHRRSSLLRRGHAVLRGMDQAQ